MRNLTLGDLAIALSDLLDKRRSELERSTTGKLYVPLLEAKRAAIAALPKGATKARANAAELDAADALHDGYGAAIWHLCEAARRHPTLSASVKAAASEARDAFVPELRELQDKFADEARAAQRRRPELTTRKTSLKAVVTPGGGTLFAWVKSFLDAGDALGELLSSRADTEAHAKSGKGAATLRATTLGLLGRLRGGIADELDAGAVLPADYEASLFAHIDELAKRRGEAERRAAPKVIPPLDVPLLGAGPGEPIGSRTGLGPDAAERASAGKRPTKKSAARRKR